MFKTLFISMMLTVAACATTSTSQNLATGSDRRQARIKLVLPSDWRVVEQSSHPFDGGQKFAYLLANSKNGAEIIMRFVPAKKAKEIAVWSKTAHDRFLQKGWQLTPIKTAEDGSTSFDASFQGDTRGHYVARVLKGLTDVAAVEAVGTCPSGADKELVADLHVIAEGVEFVIIK